MENLYAARRPAKLLKPEERKKFRDWGRGGRERVWSSDPVFRPGLRFANPKFQMATAHSSITSIATHDRVHSRARVCACMCSFGITFARRSYARANSFPPFPLSPPLFSSGAKREPNQKRADKSRERNRRAETDTAGRASAGRVRDQNFAFLITEKLSTSWILDRSNCDPDATCALCITTLATRRMQANSSQR